MAERPDMYASRQRRKCQDKKPTPKISPDWTYKDKRALIDAVKKHGLGDISKIVEAVGTKTEVDLTRFINKLITNIQQNQENSLNYLFEEHVKHKRRSEAIDYPPLALWKKAVLKIQMGAKTRRFDYSAVIADAFKQMAEEEKKHIDPSDNLPNFSNCYMFIHDCLSNTIPATLSPLDSLTVSALIGELMTFLKNEEPQLQDELKFVREYKGPIHFACMQPGVDINDPAVSKANGPSEAANTEGLMEVDGEPSQESDKTESRDIGTSTEDDLVDSATTKGADPGKGTTEHLELPEEAFNDALRHISVKNHLNPLMVPIYSLLKEQKMIDAYISQV